MKYSSTLVIQVICIGNFEWIVQSLIKKYPTWFVCVGQPVAVMECASMSCDNVPSWPSVINF